MKRLRASELSAGVAAESDRTAVHVRAVHGTWGVALGFELETLDAEKAVAVAPGFGYDCRGREIASGERIVTHVPSTDDPADLVIGPGRGARLAWREPDRACDDEIVLARATFEDGRVAELDDSVRRWCRSRRFRLEGGVVEKQLAATVTISTAAVGFGDTPYYFATLESDLRMAATLEIDNETSTGFRVTFHATAAQLREATRRKRKAKVHWVGVEPLPRCGLDSEEDQ